MALSRPIEFVHLNRLRSLRKAGEIWQVAIEGKSKNQTLCARYLIDASGRSSVVGRRLASIRKSSDRLCCVSARIGDSDAIGVWTEAVKNGRWNLCSDRNHGTISFYTTPQFLRRGSQDFLFWLGQTREMKNLLVPTHTQNLHVRFCGSSLLFPCAGPGWLEIGDAAMTFQPLASAGVAKALADAKDVLLYLAWNPADYDYFKRPQYAKYLRALLGQYKTQTR